VDLVFEWDINKADLNFRKHSVSFDEANTVFSDPLGKIFDDESHSINEVREIIIGHSFKGRLLVVVFTEKKRNLIRLISARIATKKERKNYEENLSKEEE
jgi:hypothetical protein